MQKTYSVIPSEKKMCYNLIIYRPNYIYILLIAWRTDLRREYALFDMSSTFLSMFSIAL